jgi:hypothetical protein
MNGFYFSEIQSRIQLNRVLKTPGPIFTITDLYQRRFQ